MSKLETQDVVEEAKPNIDPVSLFVEIGRNLYLCILILNLNTLEDAWKILAAKCIIATPSEDD